MHTPIKWLLSASALVFAVACQKDNMPIKTTSTGDTTMSPPADSAKSRGHSLVRVVNAVNNGKDIAVQLGDATIFSDIKAGMVTDFREVATNLAAFSVRPAGAPDGVMLAEKDRVLMDGNRYTVVLMSEDMSKQTLRIIKDDIIPATGDARIRVIAAAPGAPALDVRIAGAPDKLFSDVSFMSEAGYKDVPPALVTIEIRAKDNAKILLSIPKVDLKRGTATTIVVTGAAILTHFIFTDVLLAPTPKA